jgi:hypothetical protein
VKSELSRKPQISPLRAPGFPVGIGGVGELHAAFLTESRTRGRFQCKVAGNPGNASVEICDFFLLFTRTIYATAEQAAEKLDSRRLGP